ncbi:MAG: hypothetical protein KME60_12185 [Cyanomargarita calcarea GSE-NOS-MK-12-04C]|jgi:hypothetical protein|uniref:O-antigen polymerase n=1 Tax=Cyanomargarita calcarea GSE-NOS-MK-12-04C TaxID=2839659 RepID=A0A951QLX4_9CYAN|nr:hypothetical protein [Cyanomargarita calcarea GSE-NOS-MK-12-04C]
MSGIVKNNARIFSTVFIRWNCLTQSEKVTVVSIILIPLWWLLGWKYLFLLLATSLALHDIFSENGLHLQRPTIPVLSAIGFGLYGILSKYFYSQSNNESINPNSITWPLDGWVGFGLILWYIQSHKIRIRLNVLAWSLTIVALQMVLFWLVIYFVWKQGDYTASRSLFGLITGKGEEFIPGAGNSNYLMPYFPTDISLPGLVRYIYFFHGPESLALFVGFVCLVALDIKNRLWSWLLFSTSVFLLLTSGTRAVWVALPAVLFLRYFFIVGSWVGAWVLCAVIAIGCFAGLSVPAVSNMLFHSATNTAQSTSSFRGDSSEVRSEIYRRTFRGITEASDAKLIFGHVVTGEGVLPGYAPAVVGSHSFLLGSLLYRSGLVGTGIFLTYWVSLIFWLYNTRTGRPISCAMTFVLFSLTFSTMELELPVMPITLIFAMLCTDFKRVVKKENTGLMRKSLIFRRDNS